MEKLLTPLSLLKTRPWRRLLPARFKLQSKAPPLKELKLSTKFLALPRQERIDVVTTAWIRLHLTNGSARYTLPHSEDVLNEFTQELNRASEIRSILSAAPSKHTTNSSSSHPLLTAVNSIASSSISAPPEAPVPSLPHTKQPSTVDYSVMIPTRTASTALGANALRPEIRDHLLYRAGYVPLNILTNKSIRYMAANPKALKLNSGLLESLMESLRRDGCRCLQSSSSPNRCLTDQIGERPPETRLKILKKAGALHIN